MLAFPDGKEGRQFQAKDFKSYPEIFEKFKTIQNYR